MTMVENIKRTMLEKVAEAISISFREEGYIENESDPDEWKEFLRAAKAAITSMREPTEEMIEIGYNAHANLYGAGIPMSVVHYKSMIDAALKESE